MGRCNNMKRVFCAQSLVLFAVIYCLDPSSAAKPNIILMIADDLGSADLGCYGNTSLRTPNIDSLAGDGVRLTHNLATASVCTPSRAALLTGRHQIRTGMAPLSNLRVNLWQASHSGLPETEITLAEVTKQAGYRNAIIGKWHLGVSKECFGDHIYHPLNQGFDYFYGLLGTNLDDYANDGKTQIVRMALPVWYWQLFIIWSVTVIALLCLFKYGVINLLVLGLLLILWSMPSFYTFWIWDNFTLLTSFVNRNYDIVEQPIIHSQLSKKLVHESIEFMNNATQSGKPFLLVTSWIHTHVYIDVSEEFKGRSRHGIYGDAVEELDWSVGEILKHLDKTGARENTLVYFTSDHGGHIELGNLGGYNGILKGGKTHGAPDGAIRVPGLVRWPGVLPANTVITEPTSLMDVFHMVSSVVGVPLQTDRVYDGHDILPLLKGETKVTPHEFMFHYCGDKLHAARYSPKTGTKIWKLVSHETRYLFNDNKCQFVCQCNNAIKLQHPKLYEMTSDPGETTPIDTSSSDYSHVTSVIQTAIDKHKSSIAPVASQFTYAKLIWRPFLQPCCNGTFPFCQCTDTKFRKMF